MGLLVAPLVGRKIEILPLVFSQFEHGAWKHFYILKVSESGVKPMIKEEIPDPVESARAVRKQKKTKAPPKVWAPPPWRSSAPRPTEINR